MKKLGPLSYLAQMNGQNHKRHSDQLLFLPQVEISSSKNEDFFVPTVPALSTETYVVIL